jgi:hypothetical protein
MNLVARGERSPGRPAVGAQRHSAAVDAAKAPAEAGVETRRAVGVDGDLRAADGKVETGDAQPVSPLDMAAAGNYDEAAAAASKLAAALKMLADGNKLLTKGFAGAARTNFAKAAAVAEVKPLADKLTCDSYEAEKRIHEAEDCRAKLR